MKLFSLLTITFVLAVSMSTLLAQSQSIVCSVVDQNGISLKNSRVILYSNDTSFFREQRTDSLGVCKFVGLASNDYTIGATSISMGYLEKKVSANEISLLSSPLLFVLAPDTNKGVWEILNKAGERLGGTNSATLLPDGRILYCHDTQDPTLYDPGINSVRKAAKSQRIQGCAAVGLLPDGRVLFVGGADQETYGPGTNQVKTYNPAKDEWKVENNINDYRWYPSMIQFPDGELLAIGGGGLKNPIRVNTCEIMNPLTMKWSLTDTIAIGNEVSPIALLTTGEVLMTHRPPQLFNINTKKWRLAGDFVQGPRAPDGNHPDHEITVLPNGKVVSIGYNPLYYPNIPGNNVEIYDPIANTWKLGTSMLPVRYQCKSTLLPNKKILVTGGFKATPSDTSYTNEWGAMRLTDLYDPLSDSWQRMSGLNFAREYHSTPILIPDGRVILTAGEGKPGEEPKDTSIIEGFRPPYLFKGIRPEIVGLSQTEFPRGSEIVFRIAKTGAPTSIILKGTEAVSHFMNTGIARFLELPFTQNDDTIHVLLPKNPNAVPLGYYILFAMTDDVPSVGKIVRITPEQISDVSSQRESNENTSILNNFPNPFHQQTTVRFFLNDATEHIELNIYSVLGEKLSSYFLGEYTSGWNTFSLDEPALQPGIYYLQLKTKNKLLTTKLCVY